MEFYDYKTLYSMAPKECRSPDKFYQSMYNKETDAPNKATLAVEYKWFRSGKPYYNIWPGIIGELLKLELEDVLCQYIQFPVTPILFKLPKDPRSELFKPVDTFIVFRHDFGLCLVCSDGTCTLTSNMKLTPGSTVLDMYNHSESISDIKDQNDLFKNMTRLVAAVSLFSQDLFEPEILKADALRNIPLSDKLRRAKQRGKYGWNVGRQVQVDPHTRRPHLCRVWTGPGRKIPKIITRAGSIIHKEAVVTVPSGHEL